MSPNFPTIVTVNGFACRNKGDIGYAKRFIDPARPAAGAFGLNLPEPVGAGPESAARRPRDLGEAARTQSADPPPVGGAVDKLA